MYTWMILVHKYLHIPVLPSSVKIFELYICDHFGGSIIFIENKI